jgi:hypothetical protein
VARRDRDPRPAIEVIGGAPSSESLQEISVGGAGGGAGGAGGPGRLRGWKVVAVGVVVSAALLALFTSDGGDGTEAASSTTSTRRSTTTARPTTSTTYVAAGPLTEQPTGALLLLATQSRRWHVVDLDSGEVSDLLLDAGQVDVYSGLLPVRGGVVAVVEDGAWFVPVEPGGGTPERRQIARGVTMLMGSGRDDRVWVGSSPPEVAPDGMELRLVDLRGRTVARRRLPQLGYWAATEAGPLVSDGGRSYVADEDGLRPLGVGTPAGATASEAILYACGDDGRCGPAIVDVRTGARRELPVARAAAGGTSYSSYHVTPDGDIVELRIGATIEATWLAPDGQVVATGRGGLPGESPTSGIGAQGDPTFLPRRQGLVVLGGDGEVYRVRIEGQRLTIDRLPLPPVPVDRALVILR